MSATAKVLKYQASDVARSRWLIIYTLFFLATAEAVLRFSNDGAKALLSLSNVVLLVIPLVTIVFGTVYLYNAREFIELLLAQPVKRRQLFGGLYLGLALPLSAGFAVGLATPFLLRGLGDRALAITLATLLLLGIALTAIFTALAFLIASSTDDRLKGLGVAITLWLLTSLLYDGLVLIVVAVFADYPIAKPVLALVVANPIDLARVSLLLRFDISALMGYTGAVFRSFFGSEWGIAITSAALALWIAVPTVLGARRFGRKDF
ncbi:MAG TPA: ABC transporter permease subunit [Gemmatimonadaceae bacterium]|nr:ABC transporter permease subunit [Gemmatimonadaceae bacterium]